MGEPLGGLTDLFKGFCRSWAPFGRPWGLPRATLLRTAVSLNDWVTIWSASGGVLGPSWAVMGLSLGHIGALLGRLGALLDCLGALLGRFSVPLGRSRTPGRPKNRVAKNHTKTTRELLFFAFRLPLGGVFRAVFGRLVGVRGRLGLSRGRLAKSTDPLGIIGV